MQDIHDIKPPVAVGIDPLIFQIILAVTGAVLFCLLTWLLVRYIRKRRIRRRQKGLLLLPLPLPPHESALRELNCLGDMMTLEPRLFYFRLTAILKTYIGKVFHLNAPEMTTQEIVSALNTLDMEREILNKAREFFLSASMIKYAGVTPRMEKIQQDDGFVRNFIETFKDACLSDKGEPF